MKMTVEIPDDLLLQAKTMATIRGESLKTFITEALRAHLERHSNETAVTSWKASSVRPEERTWSRSTD
jgi:hypothetical protein